MMFKRCMLLALLSAAFAFTSGCAGVIQFNTPAQFEKKKMKEDPPEGWMAPAPETGTRVC
jgi:hypothetical protein